MASSKEYLHFILDQLSLLEGVSVRPMMGEYLLYYQGKYFGGVCDDRFLVKITPSAREMMPAAAEEPPYEGAKPMLLVDNVEDRDFLKELVQRIVPELPQPKEKKKRHE